MLSRVADNLYWMSRYLERAEHTAAVIDEHLNLMLNSAPGSSEERWSRVVASLGIIPFEPPPRSVPHSLAFGSGRRSSIVTCVSSARDNARQVREQASSEMWEQLNRLYHAVREAGAQEQWRSDPHAFLKSVREGACLFHGITDSTMNHDQAWQFIQFGRNLERAGALITLLDVHFRAFEAEHQSQDLAIHLEWIGLLKCCSAFEGYCKVYTADVKAERVAEFLLLNDVFPHSLRFCVERIHCAVQALPEGSRKATERLARLTGRLRSTLSFSDIGELMATGLHSWLDGVLRQCHLLHIAVREAYIDYPIERAMGA